jgi:hypothetical protein
MGINHFSTTLSFFLTLALWAEFFWYYAKTAIILTCFMFLKKLLPFRGLQLIPKTTLLRLFNLMGHLLKHLHKLGSLSLRGVGWASQGS